MTAKARGATPRAFWCLGRNTEFGNRLSVAVLALQNAILRVGGPAPKLMGQVITNPPEIRRDVEGSSSPDPAP